MHRTLQTVDCSRVLKLLEEAFQEKLNPEWVKELHETFVRAYITDKYTALAIISKQPEIEDALYLDKFAIKSEYQGTGVTDILWKAITDDYHTLFWRSRAINRINPW